MVMIQLGTRETSDRSVERYECDRVECQAALAPGDVAKPAHWPKVPALCRLRRQTRGARLSVSTSSTRPEKAGIGRGSRWWGILPGDVVRLEWPERNITELYMRVRGADYGKIGQGEITVNLMEDIFSLNKIRAYVPPVSQAPTVSENPRDIDSFLGINYPAHWLSIAGLGNASDYDETEENRQLTEQGTVATARCSHEQRLSLNIYMLSS